MDELSEFLEHLEKNPPTTAQKEEKQDDLLINNSLPVLKKRLDGTSELTEKIHPSLFPESKEGLKIIHDTIHKVKRTEQFSDIQRKKKKFNKQGDLILKRRTDKGTRAEDHGTRDPNFVFPHPVKNPNANRQIDAGIEEYQLRNEELPTPPSMEKAPMRELREEEIDRFEANNPPKFLPPDLIHNDQIPDTTISTSKLTRIEKLLRKIKAFSKTGFR